MLDSPVNGSLVGNGPCVQQMADRWRIDGGSTLHLPPRYLISDARSLHYFLIKLFFSRRWVPFPVSCFLFASGSVGSESSPDKQPIRKLLLLHRCGARGAQLDFLASPLHCPPPPRQLQSKSAHLYRPLSPRPHSFARFCFPLLL